jgi:hypothetical protein
MAVGSLRQLACGIVFQSAVDLVAEKVDAAFGAQGDQSGEDFRIGDGAGGIVGEIHRDDTGVRAQTAADVVEVGLPAVFRVQYDAFDLSADGNRHGFHGLVVRHSDQRVIVRPEQGQQCDVEPFLGAGKAENVLGPQRVVARGNGLAQGRRAPGFDVAQLQ